MSTEPITQDQADSGESAPESTTSTTGAIAGEASSTAETALHQLEAEISTESSNASGQQVDAAGPADGAEQADDEQADDEQADDVQAGTAEPTETGESESTARASVGTSSSHRSSLEHEGEVAADFLEQLMDIADLDGDLEVNVDGDRAAVAIVDSEDGPAPKKLVGRDAAVLESLQELTRLAVQAETGDRSRLMLDIAGHRAGRRVELMDLARRTAASVKESGERAELEPMSAFERKVVHDEVLAAGLVSESEGTEPNRYVVILPND